MNSMDLLNDYEQFTNFFPSLNTDEDAPVPADLDAILDTLTEEAE